MPGGRGDRAENMDDPSSLLPSNSPPIIALVVYAIIAIAGVVMGIINWRAGRRDSPRSEGAERDENDSRVIGHLQEIKQMLTEMMPILRSVDREQEIQRRVREEQARRNWGGGVPPD